MVDLPNPDPALLEDELRAIAAINRRFGGVSALQNALLPIILQADQTHVLEILDLATGSGDQPIELARTLRRLGRQAIITAVDNNDAVLEIARASVDGFDNVCFERGNILALPYPDRRFDCVTCSLSLHHFSWDDAMTVLGEMDRLSRLGFVVNDLARSYLAAISAWMYTRVTTRNVMTRYDAVASCLAAFTKEEILALAEEAGVGRLDVYTTPLFRLVAVKKKR